MTPLIAPAAHAGGLVASKFAVKLASCPATVAWSVGVDVAASTCSVNAFAFSAFATGSMSSPACISLCTGLSTELNYPVQQSNLATLEAVCCAATTLALGS